jgi:hypothetical protein
MQSLCKGAEVKRVAEVQWWCKWKGKDVQIWKDSQLVQRYKVLVQRCRGAEVQRCRGA